MNISSRLRSAVASSINVKTFSEIPGPQAWPLLGTLPFYKTGELATSHCEHVPKYLGKRSLEQYAASLLDLHAKYGPLVKENLGWGRGYLVHVFDPGATLLFCKLHVGAKTISKKIEYF